MGRKVFVVGVGMTKFEKPGGREWDYPDMAREAGTMALEDAGISYDLVEQAAVGYCYGDSTAGQRALYEIGVTGIPVVNVNNNCATGSSALYLAKRFVEGGLADCALALGFEKMEKGSLGIKYMDRAMPMQWTFEKMNEKRGFTQAPPGAADVRQRRPRVHGALRREGRVVRPHRGEEPPALGEQPELAVPRHLLARRHPRRADGARAAHEAAVLPDVGRRCRGDRRQRGLRARARARGPGGRDHRHVDAHRLPVELRVQQRHELRRLRHEQGDRDRTCTSSRVTARTRST